MRKITNIIWGIWCAFATLLSPVWLTMTFLNITGTIYKYDYSMDEGTAVIIGIFLLALWLFIVLLPIVGFLRYAYSLNKKNLWICIGIMIILVFFCFWICDWNIVQFLVS